MSSPQPITSISLQSLPKLSQGKVRDLFDLDASTLLFTATDRISAYDVVLANGVPQKGLILTQISAHWFSVLEQKVPGLKHHLLSLSAPASAPLTPEERSLLRGRTMTCRKLKVFPIVSQKRLASRTSPFSALQAVQRNRSILIFAPLGSYCERLHHRQCMERIVS